MNLLLDTRPARAAQRRLLLGIAAAIGVACGSGLTHAQTRIARSAQPATPATPSDPFARTPPPAPPAPPAPSAMAPMVYFGNGGGSTYVYKSVENGRTIELQLSGDRIVQASVDGQEIPADRIVREGREIVLKDENGNVLHTHTMPAVVSRAHASQGWRGQQAYGQSLLGNGRFKISSPNAEDSVLMVPPTVMIGVSMMDPDASLRGHLGLEPGHATLVSAVYDELPAAVAGIEPYDIIVSIDGSEPAGADDVRKALRSKNPGDEIKFGILHRGQKREATLKLEKYDPERFSKVKVRAIAAATPDEDSDPAMATWRRYAGDTPSADALERVMIAIAGDGEDAATVLMDPRFSEAYFERIAEMQKRAEEAAAQARDVATLAAREAAAASGQKALDDHTRQLEDRLRKMEEMIQRLLESHDPATKGRSPSGGGQPPPPPMVQRNADT